MLDDIRQEKEHMPSHSVMFPVKVTCLQIVLGEYWRLLTVIVMHAGLLHLGHNCTALFFVGAEAVLGDRILSSVPSE
jgi:membrane associated rhomboid family serine protease